MKKFTMSAFLIAVGFGVSLNPSMAQSNGSVEEVIRQAVSALASNDQSALDKLTIDAAEFKKYVWPTIAARVSGSDMTADKYYTTYRKVNQLGISEARTALAGKKWEVVKISSEPAQKQGKGYQLLSAPLITLRDESGQEKTTRLLGGLLERDGAYKVTNYYVSPAQMAKR